MSFMSGSNPFMGQSVAGDLTKKSGLSGALGEQYNQGRALQSQTQDQRNRGRGTLNQGYGSLLDSGYSPGEQSSITQQSINPIRNVFGSARSAATNRMARTNNSAGYGSFLGDLAQKEGEAVGGQSQKNQLAFADEKQRRRELGLKGIAEMYGVDTTFLGALNGAQNNDLQIGNSVESRRKGVLGTIGQIAGIGGSILGLGSGIGSSISALSKFGKGASAIQT